MAIEFSASFDGSNLAVHRLGTGRPLVLLHGLFSSAEINWIKYGTAAQLAQAGFECIMPDLRAHGQSDAPHDLAAYPPGVLAKDLVAIVEALGLTDYDLAGFSLGARTSVSAVLAGLAPRRLVLGGMGLEGLTGWEARTAHFRRAIELFGSFRLGDPEYIAQQFMKSTKVDREAMLPLLASVEDIAPEALSAITMPTLVVCGAQDSDNGSATALAAALPHARYAEIPGTHMSCVTKPDLGQAIVDFLAA